MALPGLVRANNLSDVEDREKAWNNLGNGISYEISGVTTSGVVIKGADILALNGVSNTSTKDFVRIKGLTSSAQPRLNIAANNTSSGVARQLISMPRTAPVTSGAYVFTRITILRGETLTINGTNALSIATTPFSGSTAIVPIVVSSLGLQSNFRATEAMANGVLSSPEMAIPYETDDFVLFIKAGQS